MHDDLLNLARFIKPTAGSSWSMLQTVTVCPGMPYIFQILATNMYDTGHTCAINVCFDNYCQIAATIRSPYQTFSQYQRMYSGANQSTLVVGISTYKCDQIIALDNLTFVAQASASTCPTSLPSTCATSLGVDLILDGGFETHGGVSMNVPWELTCQTGCSGIA